MPFHLVAHIGCKSRQTDLRKGKEMIEMTTNPAAQRAFQRAHAERSKAIKSVFNWLFGSR
ncbi:MAG: hypothetical protein FalmKO_30730 [Falsiruegeria mediterranea]